MARHVECDLPVHELEVLLRLLAVEQPVAQVCLTRTVEHHADEQRLELHGHLGHGRLVVARSASPELLEPGEIDCVR